MYLESAYVLDAISTIIDWDLPDESIPDAISTQVSRMTGLDAEDMYCNQVDSAVH